MCPSLKAYKFSLLVTDNIPPPNYYYSQYCPVLSLHKKTHSPRFHQTDCFSVETTIHTDVPGDLEKDVAVGHTSFTYFIIQKIFVGFLKDADPGERGK